MAVLGMMVSEKGNMVDVSKKELVSIIVSDYNTTFALAGKDAKSDEFVLSERELALKIQGVNKTPEVEKFNLAVMIKGNLESASIGLFRNILSDGKSNEAIVTVDIPGEIKNAQEGSKALTRVQMAANDFVTSLEWVDFVMKLSEEVAVVTDKYCPCVGSEEDESKDEYVEPYVSYFDTNGEDRDVEDHDDAMFVIVHPFSKLVKLYNESKDEGMTLSSALNYENKDGDILLSVVVKTFIQRSESHDVPLVVTKLISEEHNLSMVLDRTPVNLNRRQLREKYLNGTESEVDVYDKLLDLFDEFMDQGISDDTTLEDVSVSIEAVKTRSEDRGIKIDKQIRIDDADIEDAVVVKEDKPRETKKDLKEEYKEDSSMKKYRGEKKQERRSERVGVEVALDLEKSLYGSEEGDIVVSLKGDINISELMRGLGVRVEKYIDTQNRDSVESLVRSILDATPDATLQGVRVNVDIPVLELDTKLDVVDIARTIENLIVETLTDDVHSIIVTDSSKPTAKLKLSFREELIDTRTRGEECRTITIENMETKSSTAIVMKPSFDLLSVYTQLVPEIIKQLNN